MYVNGTLKVAGALGNPTVLGARRSRIGQAPSENAGTIVPKVGPFGLAPLPTGLIFIAGGAVAGILGTYWSRRRTTILGKKVSTFWNLQFGTGGIGIAMAWLAAFPMILTGAGYIVLHLFMKYGLGELEKAAAAPAPKTQG